MDFGDIPIGQRLDALLKKLDDYDDNGSESELEYTHVVKPRVATDALGDTADPSQNDKDDFAGSEDDQTLESADDRPPMEACAPALNRDTIGGTSRGSGEARLANSVNEANTPHINASSVGSSTPSPVSSGAEDGHAVLTGIYKDAGLPPHRMPATGIRKHTEVELERAARTSQEVERMYGEDVGMHTVSTRTVVDLLAGLSDEDHDADEAEEVGENSKSASTPAYNTKGTGRSDLPSSPSSVQGLRDFMSAPAPQDSDSELEIIPDTKTTRMSRPVREMLRFTCGGGTASDRKLAAERAHIIQLEQKQTEARRQAKMKKLESAGVDIDAVRSEFNQQRQIAAIGSSALLEQERQRAALIEAQERPVGDSDEEPEMDSNNENDDEGTADGPSSPLSRLPRVLSDSDGDNDDGDDDDDEEQGTDEDSSTMKRAEYPTGTQYLPPLPQSEIGELLGISSDEDRRDSHSDELGGNLPDTLPDEEDPVEIKIGKAQSEHQVVDPDLSDLGYGDLTLSQQMKEIRQRYLAAQMEQKRAEELAKRYNPKRSAFVDAEAEESDEEGGVRETNDDDENGLDEGNFDLDGLVDHRKVSVNAAELERKFREEESLRDEHMLNKFVDGVHGGFRRWQQRRRRGPDGGFLSDDEDNIENDDEDGALAEYRNMIAERRKEKLLSGTTSVARLAKSERAAAFFSSVSEDLVARPGAARRSTIQESLVFLKSVAEKDQHLNPDPGAPIAESEDMGDPHTTHPFSTEKGSLLADPPRVSLAVRRTSTVRIPDRRRQNSTYASRISALSMGDAKTVEILQSLGPASGPVKKNPRYAAEPARESKRQRHLVTAAHNSVPSLFKRSWQ